MELRHLRSFCVLAEEEHFSRASRRLNLAQPSLTAQIKLLEATLETKLFERHTRGVELTEAGRLFWESAERVLKEADHAQRALRELGDLKRGKVTVGVTQTVKACLAPKVVSSFMKQYPGAAVDVKELAADEIESGLESGKLDLGVSFGPPRMAGLEWESLFEEDLVAVVGTQHSWSKLSSVQFADMQGQRLALLPLGYCTRRLFDDVACSLGLETQVVCEMNSIEGLLLVLPEIEAVSFLPRLAAQTPSALGRCVAVSLTDPSPSRQVALLYPRRRYRSRLAEVFAEEWKRNARA